MPAKKKSKKPLAAAPPTTDAHPPQLTIVGIGASAGGLEAFSTLLQSLPKNPGVALVFVQHLAPQHESALVALLSGRSELPVVSMVPAQRKEPIVIKARPFSGNETLSSRVVLLQANERPSRR